MPLIDYSKIASTYDTAEFRAVNEIDKHLLAMVINRVDARVLDLACGTGSYIATQAKVLDNVSFFGIDLSCDMIQEARKKGISNLINANADEGLPFVEASVDYVICRFAFHHFTEKNRVLNEIWRCLRSGGVLHMHDVDPFTNRKWWVYTLFPEVAEEDRRRFWKPSQLVNCMRNIGFAVFSRIATGPEIMTKNDLLGRLRLRDTSQLHMIEEAVFKQKLFEVEGWPEDACICGDYAFLTVIGKKIQQDGRPTKPSGRLRCKRASE